MLYEVVIPLALLIMPWFAVRYVFVTATSRQVRYGQTAPYACTVAILWFIGCAMPQIPLFGGATSTFLLHTLGGIIAAILFWFMVQAYKLHFALWWQEMLLLFAFVCAGGVLNELFEFALHQTGFLADNGADTWWDLVANTLGASVAFLTARVVRRIRAPR